MEKDSLTSKVNRVYNLNSPNRLRKFLKHENFNYSSRKKIESKDVEEGIKFSLNFNPFILKDFIPGDYYQFPGGHVALIYKQGSDSLSAPFIEEKYSHPFILQIDKKEQQVYIDPELKYHLNMFPIEDKIVQYLHAAEDVLKHSYIKGSIPYHYLTSPYFNKQKISLKNARKLCLIITNL